MLHSVLLKHWHLPAVCLRSSISARSSSFVHFCSYPASSPSSPDPHQAPQQQQQQRLFQQQVKPFGSDMASAQEPNVKGAADYDAVCGPPPAAGGHVQNPMEEEVVEDDDLMCESYGEGYATRSSEEGFGGVYAHPVGGMAKGWKHHSEKRKDKNEADETPHPRHNMPPAEEFDTTQGSPVAQKEKTRFGQGIVGS